jgi:hypothetical protein
MPEFIRPKRAIIETGDDGLLYLLAVLAAAAFAILLAALVAAWIVAHAVLLAVVLGVFVVALGGFCVWCRWVSSPRRLAEMRAAVTLAQPVAPRAVQQAIQGQVVPPARPAIAPPRWPHRINLDGLSPEDIAAMFSRKESKP